MRRTTGFLAGSLALATFGWGAEAPPAVARVFATQVKPGMNAQYEAGRKRHMDFHRKQADAWAWLTWEVETGDRAGTFLTGTFGHEFKDFDDWEAKLGKADTADGLLNLVPFTASQVNGFYVLLSEFSRPTGTLEPSPLTELVHYQLEPGTDETFRNAIQKIHEAIGKSTWKVNYDWYALANGGEHPAYVLAFPMKGFADLAPLDPPFPVMLEKALGPYEAREVRESLDRCVRSARSEIVRYRSDLSYLPAPAAK
jgi:hypothetical protein